MPVAQALHHHVERHPNLVHGTPEPVCHRSGLHDDLIKVPLASCAGQPPHPAGKLLTELAHPLQVGLMAYQDAARRGTTSSRGDAR